MDINNKIIDKIKNLTYEQPQIGGFIIELLEFEALQKGFYTDHYTKTLEKYARNEVGDENPKNKAK